MKKIEFDSRIDQLPYMLGMHYVGVPDSVTSVLGKRSNLRLICRLNETVEFPCGLMALDKTMSYIMINKKRMNELGVKKGDVVHVQLEADHSKYGMPVPDEMNEYFEQDPEGLARFDKLSPGKQRNIIYYISEISNSQKRIDKLIMMMNNLRRLTPGKETFRDILGLD